MNTNWLKYHQLFPAVYKTLRIKYSSLSIELFDSIFYDAFDVTFGVFENTYEENKGSEKGYLTKLTLNDFFDRYSQYKKKFIPLNTGELIYDYKRNNQEYLNFYQPESGMFVKQFLDFFSNFLNDEFYPVEELPIKLIKNIFSSWKVIQKREFWIGKKRLQDFSIESFSNSVYLDWKMLQYKIGEFDLIEPISALKLKSWVEKKDRKWMLNSLKLSKISFQKLNNEIGVLNKPKQDYPILSAIVLNNKNECISTAYKGETGNWDQHCEYLLYEEKLNNNFHNIIGGSLFVTLEPCSNRGGGKQPCAVRISKSPVKTVYIGIVDANENILQKGIEIIRSGIYTFDKPDLGNTSISSEGSKWLFSHFMDEMKISKKNAETVDIILEGRLKRKIPRYSIVSESKNAISFAIGNFKVVKAFHPDIQMELLKLNRAFIEKHAPGKLFKRFTIY